MRKYKLLNSAVGKMDRSYWQKIPENNKNVILDEWIIMPNHLHGILLLHNELTDKQKENDLNAPRHVPTILRPLMGLPTRHCSRLAGYELIRFYKPNHILSGKPKAPL